tara:strand:+ start:284 stop:523 length:240 start_codon:yes stop_codon:yes gene_type:complete
VQKDASKEWLQPLSEIFFEGWEEGKLFFVSSSTNNLPIPLLHFLVLKDLKSFFQHNTCLQNNRPAPQQTPNDIGNHQQI